LRFFLSSSYRVIVGQQRMSMRTSTIVRMTTRRRKVQGMLRRRRKRRPRASRSSFRLESG
jgi:hypothetical protein